MALESKVQVNIAIPMKGKGGKMTKRYFTTILPHPTTLSNLHGRSCIIGTSFQTCHKIFLGERKFSIRATEFSGDDERQLMRLIKNIHQEGNPLKIAVKLRAAARPTRKRMNLFMVLPLTVVAGLDPEHNCLRWQWKTEYHASDIKNMNLGNISEVSDLIGSAEEVAPCETGNFEILHGTCGPNQVISETLKERKKAFVEDIRGRAEQAEKRRKEREAKVSAVQEITGTKPDTSSYNPDETGARALVEPAEKRDFSNIKLNINL